MRFQGQEGQVCKVSDAIVLLYAYGNSLKEACLDWNDWSGKKWLHRRIGLSSKGQQIQQWAEDMISSQ